MTGQQRRAVWALGGCQCVLWGLLYYSFSVLLVPIESALGLSRTVVAGAFSLGLCGMAVAAPAIGHWLDRGEAVRLTRVGVLLATIGLFTVAFAEGAAVLYLGWLCIGMAMSMLLYEPAFALVIRAFADSQQRLRALAAVTVLGGLASTIFLPLVSALVVQWSWRTAVLACAGAVLVVGWTMEAHVVPALVGDRRAKVEARPRGGPWPPHLATLVAIFASGTFAGTTLTTLLIPLLLDRGASASSAALVLAALGVAQLPGRIWLLRGGRSTPGCTLPVLLQALGLAGVVVAPSPWSVAGSVAVFGVGAGLQTLARPWLVGAIYGAADAGRWNGEVARIQGFARAAGPLAAAGFASLAGMPLVLAAVGGLLVLTLPLAGRLPVDAG